MPFSTLDRSSGNIKSLYRGPRLEAAVMCAASPMVVSFWGLSFGPQVRHWHKLHFPPARLLNNRFVGMEKSSRTASSMPLPAILRLTRALCVGVSLSREIPSLVPRLSRSLSWGGGARGETLLAHALIISAIAHVCVIMARR